jgi:hypothetical protein
LNIRYRYFGQHTISAAESVFFTPFDTNPAKPDTPIRLTSVRHRPP